MENVKVFFAALIGLGHAVDQAYQNDGKLTVADIALLIGPATQVPGAIAAFKPAKEEWINASAEQKNEIIAWFSQQLNIASDKSEEHIEAVFAALTHLSVFFKK